MEQDIKRRRRLALMLRIAAIMVIALGMLHASITFYEARGQIDLITLGLIVYSWLPYLVCLLLAVGKTNPVIPLCGALLPFFLNLMMYCSAATSSTAQIGLIFMPLLDFVLFMPIGLLTGFLLAVLLKKEKYL